MTEPHKRASEYTEEELREAIMRLHRPANRNLSTIHRDILVDLEYEANRRGIKIKSDHEPHE